MKLLIADDHTLFREALVKYIERAEPSAEITEARDLHDVMETMERDLKPDIVLLDMRMPGMNGLKGLEKFRELYEKTPVILLSGVAEPHDVKGALALGASGFIPKTISGHSMLKGIHQVIEGGEYVPLDHNTDEIMPSYYADKIAATSVSGGGFHDNAQAGFSHSVSESNPQRGEIILTPRESEVLDCLLRGASNKDIARELDIQIVTVKLHVSSLFRKFGVKSRTQVVVKAQQLGLGAPH